LPWHKKTDPLLTDIRNKYGMEYLKDFGLDGELNNTIKKCEGKATGVLAMSKSVAALLDTIHLFLCGSNSYCTKETQKRKSDICQ
jgi:penicillin amidase